MFLIILIILIVLLVFGGLGFSGGVYRGPGLSLGGILLVVLILWLILGR